MYNSRKAVCWLVDAVVCNHRRFFIGNFRPWLMAITRNTHAHAPVFGLGEAFCRRPERNVAYGVCDANIICVARSNEPGRSIEAVEQSLRLV